MRLTHLNKSSTVKAKIKKNALTTLEKSHHGGRRENDHPLSATARKNPLPWYTHDGEDWIAWEGYEGYLRCRHCSMTRLAEVQGPTIERDWLCGKPMGAPCAQKGLYDS